jgi:hypothetical protein
MENSRASGTTINSDEIKQSATLASVAMRVIALAMSRRLTSPNGSGKLV